jgi:hypothetical protein
MRKSVKVFGTIDDMGLTKVPRWGDGTLYLADGTNRVLITVGAAEDYAMSVTEFEWKV